jgi:hypothetical protein
MLRTGRNSWLDGSMGHSKSCLVFSIDHNTYKQALGSKPFAQCKVTTKSLVVGNSNFYLAALTNITQMAWYMVKLTLFIALSRKIAPTYIIIARCNSLA